MKNRFGIDVTVTQVPRDDGTVHYRLDYVTKPLSERVCDWTVASLWMAAGAVLVGTALTF